VIHRAAFAPVVFLAGTLGAVQAGEDLETAKAAFVQQVGPLDPAAYAPAPIPDERNAVVPIRAALALLAGAPKVAAGSSIHTCSKEGLPKDPAQLASLRTELAPFAAAFEKALEANGRPGSNWGLDYTNPDHDLSNRSFELLLAAACDAKLALADRQPRRAVDRTATVGTIARTLALERVPLHAVMGVSGETLHLRLLRLAVADPRLGDDELRMLAATIPDHDPFEALARVVAWDSASMLRVVERTGRAKEHEPERGLLGEVRAWFEWPWYGERWEVLMLRSSVTIHAAVRTPGEADDLPAVMEAFRWPAWAQRLGVPFPNYPEVAGRARANETLRRMARLAINARLLGTRGACTSGCDPYGEGALVWENATTLTAPSAAARAAKEELRIVHLDDWRWVVPRNANPGDKSSAPARPTE
jgi:hypothetical protein